MKTILRWPGAKWRIADWIIRQFPTHDVYVEPFFGSGAVFFFGSHRQGQRPLMTLMGMSSIYLR
jgi:site-specific DNA-adenine methylase